MRPHRELLAWQRANALVQIAFAPNFQPLSRTGWPVFDQLRRSALSAQLNISEGHASGTPANFKRMLNIAYGSAIETEDLLEIARACSLAPREPTERALGLVWEVQALVLGLKHSIRRP